MFGLIFCRLWAHKWMYLFSNQASRAVFGCQRCMKTKADAVR